MHLLLVGDLVLDAPEVDELFASTAALLRSGDVTIGHVEIPHTLRGQQHVRSSPAPLVDPQKLGALARAGFDICSMAGNHVFDRGRDGIEDTLLALHGLGIRTAGAGLEIEEARRPAIIERSEASVGLLSYNCVGEATTWATAGKAGCAYVRVLTHYELDYANPGGPPEIFTFAEPASLRRMQADVRTLREQVDVVLVAFHKGMVHTPATVADYETQIAHAAIDAGADAVVGHHAHLLQAIEFYRGRPIFHGLGNFVTTTPALLPSPDNDPDARAWAARRKALFNFEPLPGYSRYPFHPEAVHTIIAALDVDSSGVIGVGFYPCLIGPDAQPVLLDDEDTSLATRSYVEHLSRAAGFAAKFTWQDGRVRVEPAA